MPPRTKAKPKSVPVSINNMIKKRQEADGRERSIAATHTTRAQQPDLNRSRPGEVGNRYIRIPRDSK